jgi:hypothetical protein
MRTARGANHGAPTRGRRPAGPGRWRRPSPGWKRPSARTWAVQWGGPCRRTRTRGVRQHTRRRASMGSWRGAACYLKTRRCHRWPPAPRYHQLRRSGRTLPAPQLACWSTSTATAAATSARCAQASAVRWGMWAARVASSRSTGPRRQRVGSCSAARHGCALGGRSWRCGGHPAACSRAHPSCTGLGIGAAVGPPARIRAGTTATTCGLSQAAGPARRGWRCTGVRTRSRRGCSVVPTRRVRRLVRRTWNWWRHSGLWVSTFGRRSQRWPSAAVTCWCGRAGRGSCGGAAATAAGF